MKRSSLLGAALFAASLSGQVMATNTVLRFTGLCENALCNAAGANGTTQSTVSATLTLSDLTWDLIATGGYEASVSDAFDFGYLGPNSFLNAGTTQLNGDKSYFYSATPSVDGIYEFNIVWGESIGGAPGQGFLSGNSSGWKWGGYTLLPVGTLGSLLPFPYNIHSSSIPGQWTASAVPEPGVLSLVGIGLGTLAWSWRRHRASQASA